MNQRFALFLTVVCLLLLAMLGIALGFFIVVGIRSILGVNPLAILIV